MTRPPRTVLSGRYLVEEFAGDGASGSVWHGRARGSGARVVLYEHYSRDRERHRRLIDACTRAHRLTHRALLPWLACGVDRGPVGEAVWLAAPHVPSKSLSTLLKQGPLGLTPACRIGADLAEGLAFAHIHGLVHGACEPGLVRVVNGRAVLIGLGLQAGGEEEEEPDRFSIRRRYRAPELLGTTPPEPAADQFSAAALVFEMAVGSPARDLAAEQRQRRLRAVSGMDSDLATALLRAMSDRPTDRHQCLAPLAQALHHHAQRYSS